MSKHDAMKAYLEPKANELAGSALNFNFSADTPDTIACITEYGDRLVKRYLHGGSRKQYGFAILITQSYSDGTDDLNLKAMNLADGFNEWIATQNKAKLYPDFGPKCHIEKIEPMQNMPNLAAVDIDQAIARYMLQCRVTYYEEE